MIAPPSENTSHQEINVEEILREKLVEMPLKSAVREVVSQYGLNKNEVYERALRIKNEQ
jgi:16S rRNA C1402 (ribose-2'-O) methylase RsmI